MNFIEALRLKSKLFFIYIIITVGLIIIGVMGAINLNSMKKNLDSLYFGSLVPVTELSTILQTYHGNLANTIYRAKNFEISPYEVKAQIKNSIDTIYKEWKSYEAHYKKEEEIAYVEYAASEIRATNSYFLKILEALEDGYDIKDLSISNFGEKISHIHQVINKLITYEVDVARYERKSFLNIYSSILMQVSIVLIAVTFGVTIISYYVFKSIQNDQEKLEIITRKLKRANKKLEEASYTDSLTGLYNRRYFNLVYDREIKRAKRTHSYITFMMLDIDYFKQYNDTYGHIQGDIALKSVAKVLQDAFKRPSDFVFRLGGEEFGILLTETSDANSAILAGNICDLVRESKIEHRGSKVNKFLTISIGIACCVADEALDDELLITRADEMLYSAKESGRDRYGITTNISVTTPYAVNE